MNIKLRFITPCFCAGSDQLIAEIRSSAIRGELRWWFRCLGGSRVQEEMVFGTTAGKGGSSSVIVRVSDFERLGDPYVPSFTSPNDPYAYHHYFLSVPNEKGTTRMWEVPPSGSPKRKGKIREESQIPVNSSFTLSLLQTRAISDEKARLLFEKSVECLFALGSIGYRKTRGFGAWVADSKLGSRHELEDFLKDLQSYGFTAKIFPSSNKDSMAAFRQIEGCWKADKKAGRGLRLYHPARKGERTNPTPMGHAGGSGDRQTSAVYFRPVGFKTHAGDTQYSLLIFQVPDSVLGDAVQTAYAGRTRIVAASDFGGPGTL